MDPNFFTTKPVIGMVHLGPLPGSPQHESLSSVLTRALADTDALIAGGIDAVMMENFGDAPFYPDQVPAATVAAMTRIAIAVREKLGDRLPLGINVLRNDGLSALAIAKAVEADFIRVNILTGARLTDQGIIAGRAHELMRMRRHLDCSALVFADVDVKHSAPLAPYDLVQETKDLCARGGADVVVVSGSGTGGEVDTAQLQQVKNAASKPVVIGSGLTAQNIGPLLSVADGAIVGSTFKPRIDAPVEVARVKELVAQKKGG